MGGIGDLVSGLGSIGRALGLFSRSGKLRRLAIAPAIISALLLGVLIWLSFRYSGAILDWVWDFNTVPADWQGTVLSWAHWAAQALVTVVLILISGALFFFGSTVVAEPFIDLLSEQAERDLGHEVAKPKFGLGQLLKDLVLVLRDVAIDITLFLLCQVIVFLLNFIPGVGTVLHVIAGWLVNITFAGLEMSGMGLARRGIRGFVRWQYLKANKYKFLGLGAGVVLVLLIPLAQLITLPIAVVAGTLVVIDLERQGRLQPAATP